MWCGMLIVRLRVSLQRDVAKTVLKGRHELYGLMSKVDICNSKADEDMNVSGRFQSLSESPSVLLRSGISEYGLAQDL